MYQKVEPVRFVNTLTLIGAYLIVSWIVFSISFSLPDMQAKRVDGTAATLIDWNILAGLMLTGYFVASFRPWRPVQPDEKAVRIVFGKPTDYVGPGLVFAPLGIFEVVYQRTNTNQKEFPAEPELVFDGDLTDRSLLPEGMKPAIRITFNDSLQNKNEAIQAFGKNELTVVQLRKVDPRDYYVQFGPFTNWSELDYHELERLEVLIRNSGDLDMLVTFNVNKAGKDGLNRRLTAKVVPVALWRVVDPLTFISRVTPLPEDSREELINKWLEDDMVGILQKFLPLMSVAQALENMPWINARLYLSATKRMIGYGVEIQDAFVKVIPIHHSLNEKISAHAGAYYVAEAEAEIIERTGAANAQVARITEAETLKGRGEGMKAAADAIGVSGENMQAAEVARAMAEGGNTIIVGTDGIAQIVGLAQVLKAGAQPKPTTDSETPATAADDESSKEE